MTSLLQFDAALIVEKGNLAMLPDSNAGNLTVAHERSLSVTSGLSPDLPSIEKTQKVSNDTFRKIGDIIKGLAKSKIVRSLLFAAAAVVALFLIVASPPGWLIAVVAIGSFLISLLTQLPFKKGKQKLEFEISAFTRLIRGKNFNHIRFDSIFKQTPDFKIFLGAMPNRLSNDGALITAQGVQAILSVTDPSYERKPLGLSLPYSEEDWQELGIDNGDFKPIDVKDHTLLELDVLNDVADWINEKRKEGKSVYVHCRAGVGRSAMAVAAYLIKYEGRTPEQVKDIILASRPVSTIVKKLGQLSAFQEKVLDGTYPKAPE